MQYDVLIHGGGIHGVATALDCSLRGLRVLLIDRYDFGFGATTNNSKLIHGGLRYLEQLDFSLVRESLQERSWLLKNAPEYVKPLPFILPYFENSSRPSWMIQAGLFLYDTLSLCTKPKNSLPFHEKWNRKKTAAHLPDLTTEGLSGAFHFYDAQMDDRRLLFTMLKEAMRFGTVAKNWSEPPKEATAKIHFYALGAFDEGKNIPILRTKGVHLVLPDIGQKEALLLSAPQDKRVFFVIPWEGVTLLGTTDTPFYGNPEACFVEKADVDYLMTAFYHYFPRLQKENISPFNAFAGLRPLMKEEGKKPSDLSRHFQLIERENEIYLIGGKYTTFRQAAMKASDLIEEKTRGKKSFSGLKHFIFPPYQIPTLEEAISEEKVRHLDDFYFRRTSLGLTQDLTDIEEKSYIIKEAYLLSEDERKEEINRCLKLRSQNRPK